MNFELKMVAGKSILFVMAAEAEYGPALRAKIAPLMTGIGPVEAAVAVTLALSRLQGDRALPDLVLSLGSAGSATLEQTGIYQASALSYRDMDVSPLGFAKGVTPFLDLPAIIDLPLRVPGISAATLSTGANIVSGAQAYAGIEADMVDMESFAIWRACQKWALPMIGLRGISDGKDELRHVSDWTEYLHVIDAKLAGTLDVVFAAIEDGAINL